MELFLDDSGKENQRGAPYVCMAGYLAETSEWTCLERKWQRLLAKHQISSIHMKELIQLVGEYKNLGWDLPKRDAVLAEFIDTIRKSSLIGIGMAVDVEAWRIIKAKYKRDKLFGTAQEFCLQRILRRLFDRFSEAGSDIGTFSIVFDRDPEFAAGRLGLYGELIRRDSRANHLIDYVAFANPARFAGLQCADLLAWETRKEVVQKAGGHKSTKRCEQLFSAMPDYRLDYTGEFWDEKEFEKYVPPVLANLEEGM